MLIQPMIAGIDEAGRGPVIGPMVMVIVSINKNEEEFLKKIGVKDSKLLTENQRNVLYKEIKKLPHKIIKVSPEEIDKHVLSENSSLNILEAITSTKLINSQENITKVIVDLPSKNKTKYVEKIKEKLKREILIQAEFKADLNYVVVSAASILAKVTRDREIEKIQKMLNVEIGSGYPSDPYTKNALIKHFKELQPYLRKSWKTIANLQIQKEQTKLSSF